MINKLQKRDCGINIKLTPSGAQYLHFEMQVDGDKFDYLPASTVGVQFGAFVSAVYKLFIEDIDNEHTEWGNHEYLSDENHVIHTVVTKVAWEDEGTDIDIVFSRKVTDKYTPNVKKEDAQEILQVPFRRGRVLSD